MMRHRPGLSAARILSGAALSLLSAISLGFGQSQVQLFIDQSFVAMDGSLYCWYDTTTKHFNCLDGRGPGGVVWPAAGAVRPFSLEPDFGNISNQPNIEFDQRPSADTCYTNFTNQLNGYSYTNLPLGTVPHNYCNGDVFLCAAIGYNNAGSDTVALDVVHFEIFKFQDGSNPLDPASTPPLRTFFIDSPGILGGNTNSDDDGPKGPYCVLFDGATNIQGEFGKTNGQYGFRVTVQTNQTGSSGNITITAQRAYPAGATQNCEGWNTTTCTQNKFVLQKPIAVDVTNVHYVRSSATIVGSVTGIYAQPYNLTYRLSKDATMYLTINNSSPPFDVLRTVVPGLPRVGEGSPQGTLINGDSWNGRADNGELLPSGVYLATLQALSADQFGRDLSYPTTRQVALDPLQITDIRVQPLLGGSTSLAVLSYVLTEPATVYIDIYPPNTQFCRGLNTVGDAALDQTADSSLPPKDFRPCTGTCAAGVCTGTTVRPIRRITEFKQARVPAGVVSYWDGRDAAGNVSCTDGDYNFVMYAALPSQNGSPFGGAGSNDRRIWTNSAKTGFVPVQRGFVGMSQITPSATVIGSSPPISGLNPFVFRYSLGREGNVSLKIFDASGTNLKRTLIDNVVRPGLFANQEVWNDAVDNTGQWVTSGTYIAQLTAADPLCPAKVSTVSASFPVDLFRLTDVQTTPLLSGASDMVTLNYQPSQTMNTVWSIYPPGTVILNSTTTWPPCNRLEAGSSCYQVAQMVGGVSQPVAPLITFKGTRPGRMRITEYWDGRDANGLYVPDGSYFFTLVAQSSTTPQYFASDKVFGSVTVSRGAIIFTTFKVDPYVPPLFNSSATITLAPFSVQYALTRQSSVTIQVLNNNATPGVVRTVISGMVRDGGVLLEDLWDGRDERGNFPPPGFYLVRAVAQDVAAQLSQPSTAQLTISYDPLRIFDVAIAPLTGASGGAQILYQVSETMKVSLKIYRPGTVFDAGGNPSPPESVSLVKVIVGVRPARTQIIENWDGTDLRLGRSPDGNYKFSIVASTDMNTINNITGNVITNGSLAEDRPLDEVPVARDLSTNPSADFEGNTYIYPNPIDGNTAHFVIYTPFQATAKMKIYTMNGDLVLDKDFGVSPANSYVIDGTVPNPTGFVWDRRNAAGKRVARGVYYAVIRVEENLGGKNVLQTVKKFLVR